MYILGIKENIDVRSIEDLVDFELHKSYLAFVEQYGYGEICECASVGLPDEEFFSNNFAEYSYLWDWKDEAQLAKVKKGLMVLFTYDGGNVYCIDDEKPFLLFGTGDTLLEFDTFEDVIQYYLKIYEITPQEFYYSSSYKSTIESYRYSNQKEIVEKRIVNELESELSLKVEDAKYLYQAIGGWINFGHSIRIKYQAQFEENVELFKSIIEKANRAD